MTEGSDTERFSTWIANWQVTARKNETGLSPVVWNSNYFVWQFLRRSSDPFDHP